MNNKPEKQEWPEKMLKGRITETLFEELMRESIPNPHPNSHWTIRANGPISDWLDK